MYNVRYTYRAERMLNVIVCSETSLSKAVICVKRLKQLTICVVVLK